MVEDSRAFTILLEQYLIDPEEIPGNAEVADNFILEAFINLKNSKET
jgi:hypothetical protein